MLTFRKIAVPDIMTVNKLAQDIWTVSYAEMLSPAQIEYMLNWMYAPATIETEINEGVLWEFIEEEGSPIGFIAVTPLKEELKLNKLYIHPAEQGKGIGQAALQHVFDHGKKNGFKSVYLTVNKGNTKAIKAYTKAGFVCTDSKVFDIGGGYVMDDYIYTYVL
ncbi:MAG TPA: GNAT family N-acetyltransferase [Bacteroidales bacterium]|nr:GNAT family N-acetyltransferase [Bacteroidales bacterium]